MNVPWRVPLKHHLVISQLACTYLQPHTTQVGLRPQNIVGSATFLVKLPSRRTLDFLKETDSRSFCNFFKRFETTCLASFTLPKIHFASQVEKCQAAPPGFLKFFNLACKGNFRECKRSETGGLKPSLPQRHHILCANLIGLHLIYILALCLPQYGTMLSSTLSNSWNTPHSTSCSFRDVYRGRTFATLLPCSSAALSAKCRYCLMLWNLSLLIVSRTTSTPRSG